MFVETAFLKKYTAIFNEILLLNYCLSQTLFGNPKGPVEQGNPNTCAETKLCLILFYSGSRSSLL